VEPGTKQAFTYVTMVPEDIGYVLLHAKLEAEIGTDSKGHEHENDRVFTEERVFQVVGSMVSG
jgi:hypothetical protein